MLKNNFLNKLTTIVLLFLVFISQQVQVFADTVPLSGSINKTVTISARVVPSIVPVIPPETSGSTSSSGSISVEMPTIVNFYGVSRPSSKVYILQDGKIVTTTTALNDNKFAASINLNTTNNYNFSVYAIDVNNLKSSIVTIPIFIKKGITVNVFNIYLTFKDEEVGEVNVTPNCPLLIGDLNCDNHVNLTDYTIMNNWYKKGGTPPSKVDLNHDGKTTLVDFSIMMYHWTD